MRGSKRQTREWEHITNQGVKVCMKLPRTYPQAVKEKAAHYYTNTPCKYGHMVVRRTCVSGCPRCNQLKSRAQPMDSRPPHMVQVFHQRMNINSRQLGFRAAEGSIIEE